MNKKLVTFKTNIDAALIRNEKLADADYVVVPVVAIVEGVLNGVLVSADEIAIKTKNGMSVEFWGGIPVPVHHPQQNGAFLSANTPIVEETQNIGRFYNEKFEDNSLKGELWINVARAEAVNGGKAVLEALQKDEIVEVSTAYYCFEEDKAGEFNGKKYTKVAHTIRPNHIAVLPGAVGACSVGDGCGAGRANAKQTLTTRMAHAVANAVQSVLGANELDHDAIRNRLSTLVRKGLGSNENCYVALVYADRFVYELYPMGGPGRYFQRGYAIGDNDQITLGADIVEVQLQTVAVPAQNASQSGGDMQPKANCSCGQPAQPTAPDASVVPKANTLGDLALLTDNAEIKAQLLAIENKDKADREAALKALKDVGSELSDETLAKMGVNELQVLAKAIKPTVDFSGRGGPRQATPTTNKVKAPPAVFGKAPAQDAE